MVQIHLLLDLLHLEAVKEQMDNRALELQQLEVLVAVVTEKLLEAVLLEHLDKVLLAVLVVLLAVAVVVHLKQGKMLALA
jgi:hypothetical protein